MRPSTVSLLTSLLLSVTSVCAQLPERVVVELRVFNGAEPLNGLHHLTVRWYDVPVNGAWIDVEEFDVDVEQGIAKVQLGSTIPLPHTLLRSGNAWIGVSVDGGPELSPRTMLVSVPYAQYSERAFVADRLADEVTGIVSSLNEIAGAVKVLGEGGIVVRNDDDALVIGNEQPIESGVVLGNGQHEYLIKPLTKISSACRVTASVVSPTTTITCGIAAVDVVSNTIRIITAAALAPDESIHWFLLHR